MTQWIDHVLGKNPEEMPCVAELKEENVRVRVLEDSDAPGPVQYLIEVHSRSDLRNEWLVTARFSDFDLHRIMVMLLRAAEELYRIRGAGIRLPRDE